LLCFGRKKGQEEVLKIEEFLEHEELKKEFFEKYFKLCFMEYLGWLQLERIEFLLNIIL
jgi:hypothetical protein